MFLCHSLNRNLVATHSSGIGVTNQNIIQALDCSFDFATIEHNAQFIKTNDTWFALQDLFDDPGKIARMGVAELSNAPAAVGVDTQQQLMISQVTRSDKDGPISTNRNDQMIWSIIGLQTSGSPVVSEPKGF
jgi:hypothetical protein